MVYLSKIKNIKGTACLNDFSRLFYYFFQIFSKKWGGIDKYESMCYNPNTKYNKEMEIMLNKKSIYTVIIAIMLSICTIFGASCSLFSGKIKDELPEENITKIERITVDFTNGDEESVALSADKIDMFMGVISQLEYVKYYNIRRLKYVPAEEVYYVITYETYKVELSEYRIVFYKDGEWQSKTRFKSISPMVKYNQLSALFKE